MDMAFTKMSSKGQVVIPREMRNDIPKGEKMLIMKKGNNYVMKPAKDLSKKLEEDLEFAIRTEEAYLKHERGDSITMEWADFMKEFKKW
jgi:bifunctional DNA-binding transcriptional regulator/antitoxin component of YhaV-PrlF toxin-antitoxin module